MIKNYKEWTYELKEKVKKSDSICLVSHVQPDGDSIGSLLALGLALREVTKAHIKILGVDKTPESLMFLPQVEYIEKITTIKNFDLLITLDCSDLERLGDSKFIADYAREIVNIDHHISNQYFGAINIVNPEASSTGEIVYSLLVELHANIDKDIATCLYVAISTDTGSFKYENTTSITHVIASKLLQKGIDISRINTEIYQNRSLKKTNLLIKSLNTMELFYNNRLGIVTITKELLSECDVEINETDGIIDFVRDINTIEVACILKEVNENEIKVGLRSKRYINVAKIAESLNGGGHKRASGCTIKANINVAKDFIKNEVEKNLG